MFKEMFKFGKKCVDSCLVSGNFGNMSFISSDRNSLFITKSGSFMDELSNSEIVNVPLIKKEALEVFPEDARPSSELPVHRAIFEKTDFNCIIHVHSPYSVVISIIETEKRNKYIYPIDSEGQLFFEKIPIVTGSPGSSELAENVSEALKSFGGVIIKGHGTFVAAKDFSKAYVISSLIEHSARTLYLYNKIN